MDKTSFEERMPFTPLTFYMEYLLLRYNNYLKEKLKFIKILCDNLRKRNEYLEKIIKAIIDIQKDFFLSGNMEDIKPMTYDDLKKKSGMSISTISRIVSKKKVQTDFGIFLLKDVFSRSINY